MKYTIDSVRPGPGWQHIYGPIWEQKDGTRIHLLGTARLPNGVFISSNDWPHSRDADFMIRANGGNRKRGLMAWAMQYNRRSKCIN